ncbi:MAG TPA: hypothetical protein DDW52_14240 [Planctomycetaceae bacterium]|nr:hypothetical protein [Planctomycetaceae bacterium]
MASDVEQQEEGGQVVDSSVANQPRPPILVQEPTTPNAPREQSSEDRAQANAHPAPPPPADSAVISQAISNQPSSDQPAGGVSRHSETVLRFLPRPIERIFARRGTAPLLISIIAHTLLLLLLAVLTLAISRHDSDRFNLCASPAAARQTPDPLVILPDSSNSSASPAQQAVPIQPAELNSTEISESLDQLSNKRDSGKSPGEAAFASQSEAIQQVRSAASFTSQADFTHMGVENRDLRKRQQTALANGGTLRSEQAVENALRWLAEHQMASGAWSVVHDTHKCKGRCANNGSPERFDTAATGLALLAFLGAGYTHQNGAYQETVQRGLYFLIRAMEDAQGGGSWMYTSDKGMYNHGIAAFAISEAYQMTGDPDLKRAAQRGSDFIAYAQNYVGGWGYLPGKPGDLTISGWQVMALKSAQAAKLSLPGNLTFRLDKFLKTQQVEGKPFYGYRRPEKQATCTAIGNLIRLLRGQSPTDPDSLEAAEYLLQQGVNQTDVYFNYYASLYLFHIGGPTWESFNEPVREYLISTQSTNGHEAGSWYFDNQYGKVGGRLYTTAMAAMTLEVYYRYQPLYQQVGTAFEL